MKNDDIIVGLDIGTTKIAAVVGRKDEYGQLNIVGVGQAPSDGLRRGVVINIRKTIQSIKKAIEDVKSRAWTKPVVANGKLYLRYMQQLVCYELKY